MLVGALILGIHVFGDTQEDWLIVAMVIAAAVTALGYLLVLGIREWKKPDEEILNGYSNLFQLSVEKSSKKTRTLYALAVVVCVVIWLRAEWIPAGMKSVLAVLAVLTVCILLLIDRVGGKQDSCDKKEPWKRKIRQEAWVAIAIGIPTNGFFLFCAVVGTYHGVWWFVVPLAAIFMLHFLRGPVAGIRHIQRIRRGIDTEPWEKKDRILK